VIGGPINSRTAVIGCDRRVCLPGVRCVDHTSSFVGTTPTTPLIVF